MRQVCCGYEHASYVLANVVVLVTPNRPPSASGWNDEHTIQVRKWMKNVASSKGNMTPPPRHRPGPLAVSFAHWWPSLVGSGEPSGPHPVPRRGGCSAS